MSYIIIFYNCVDIKTNIMRLDYINFFLIILRGIKNIFVGP